MDSDLSNSQEIQKKKKKERKPNYFIYIKFFNTKDWKYSLPHQIEQSTELVVEAMHIYSLVQYFVVKKQD